MLTFRNYHNAAFFVIFTLHGVLVEISPSVAAYSLGSSSNDIIFPDKNPEYMAQMFTKLRQAYTSLLDDDNDNWTYSKRGLDLGLGRGFSGSQAAKHRMGLAVANFAGGPGRRRRNEINA